METTKKEISGKRHYVRPEIVSERLERTAFACTCTSEEGMGLNSFLALAQNIFTSSQPL